MEELAADPAVEPDAAGDVVDVGADLLAEIGDLVDEGDLGREEAVGGVLDQLGGPDAGEDDRRLDQEERPVELAHHLAGPLAAGADHHPVRPHEINDRRAFAQELRVRGDVEFGRRIGRLDAARHLAAGAHRHRRLGDDDGIAGERLGDLLRRGEDVAEIGMAVAAPARRADGDEYRIRPRRGRRQVGAEGEPAGPHVAVDQRLEPGLVDRHLAAPQPLDLGLVLVDAGDLDAELGEAGAGHQPDIAAADHHDAHRSRSFLGRCCRDR